MNSIEHAKQALKSAWPQIKQDCLAVLGSELHYQAMVYHALRTAGAIPADQLGMNVKMWINNPVSELFRSFAKKKHANFQGGFEPIPDIVIFKSDIKADWRRRNRSKTLINMLAAIEVKASERAKGRLSRAEIALDIRKLASHREEIEYLSASMLPVMLIIDSAPDAIERMRPEAVSEVYALASELNVAFMYISPDREICDLLT